MGPCTSATLCLSAATLTGAGVVRADSEGADTQLGTATSTGKPPQKPPPA
jgi:hypothetical protein